MSWYAANQAQTNMSRVTRQKGYYDLVPQGVPGAGLGTEKRGMWSVGRCISKTLEARCEALCIRKDIAIHAWLDELI